MKYKMTLGLNNFWFFSGDLQFLTQKIEFFNTFRNGVRAKTKIIC